MAAPNLMSLTTATLKTTAELAVTTSYAAVLSNAAGSGKALYVMSLRVSNITSATAGTVSVARTRSAVDTEMPKTFSVGPTDVLTAIDKENPLVLEEGDDLRVLGSAGSVYKAIATYVDMS